MEKFNAVQSLTNTSPANPCPAEIRAAREAAGLSQVEAGALLYRSGRNWQQWELGERRMDPALWELFRIKITMNNVHK
jgi:DNA-binding transcriptional regulator YiaG